MYFCNLHFPNLETIQRKTLAWLHTTEILKNRLFWNDVSLSKLIPAVPELAHDLFTQYQLRILYATVILISSPRKEEIHVDAVQHLNLKARVQVPILNTAGSFTEFYRVPPEKLISKNTVNGIPYILAQGDRHEKVAELELLEPAVLRISEPHVVSCRTNKYPRIALTLRTHIDPVYLL